MAGSAAGHPGLGELLGDLESRIAAGGLPDRVCYHGLAANPAEVFQNLDVFEVSSISEG